MSHHRLSLLPLLAFTWAMMAAHIAAAAEADGLIPSAEPDWAQFRGPRRDGIAEEKGLLARWPAGGPKLLWRIDGLGRGWSSPIVVGDRLYVTGDLNDNLVLFAFNLDGQPVWRGQNGRAWTGSYPGSRACCAFSAGKLYLLNSRGRLACLDAAKGKEVWTVDLVKEFDTPELMWGMSECPVIDGAHLFITPGGTKALAAALDKNTGRTIWASEPLPEDRCSHSSALLFRHAGRRILANCSAAHGFGVDADTGKLLWTVPLPSPYGVNVATPVYSSDRVFFVSAYVGAACYGLKSAADGRELPKAWENTLDTCTGGAVLVDSMLYGSGYHQPKSWLCVDWKTGRTRYEFKKLTTGEAVYADGHLFCLAEDGRAALLTPKPDHFDVDGEFRLVNDVRDAWAHPVLLHGRLYLRYHDTLWCYAVGAE